MKSFRPMLALQAEKALPFRFPYLAQPKVDGIRITIIDGVPRTRSGKRPPNENLYRYLLGCTRNYDGEIVSRDGTFQDTTSIVMSHDKPIDNLLYCIYDLVSHESFRTRDQELRGIFRQKSTHQQLGIELLSASYLEDERALKVYVEHVLSLGYEGAILRNPTALYKHGRADKTHHQLIKIKAFKDSEGTCIGVKEKMHNDNPLEKDELGFAKRSSHKGGLVSMQTMGALVVSWKGKTLHIGTGFSDQQRKEFWENPPLGKRIKFKYMEAGMKKDGLPRHPVFLGIRDSRDMSETQNE